MNFESMKKNIEKQENLLKDVKAKFPKKTGFFTVKGIPGLYYDGKLVTRDLDDLRL